MLRQLWIIILLLVVTPASFAVVRLTAANVSQTDNKTQIIFTLSGSVKYRTLTLSNPDRLALDLSNTQLATQFNTMDLSNTILQGIRGGKTNKSDLRLVLDLKQKPSSKKITLVAQGKKGYQLIVDLGGTPSKAVEPTAITTAVMSATEHQQPGYFTVVIDPGHGGKDPGATGRRGTHEKDIVLSIAKYLQKDLSTVPGIKVCMTRSGDYFVTLRGRIAIARKCKADMFIAIHADAYRNSRAYGVSVFALSQRGATSESARWLADRENTSEMLGGSIDLSDKSHLLSSVLIDLSQTATINSSLELGNKMIKRLSYVARMHSYKVDQAAFVVLKSPDIPSLLVETGFLSNSLEEQNLRNPKYRQQIAEAMKQAVADYFKISVPQSSNAKNNMPTTYKVRKGDSLSLIAFKYNVSTSSLKKVNKLRSDKVHVGQVLKIPGSNND